ncbi:MAG: helix-turn-helix transcriptional regulator [Clostridiaceae bacterium]|nr:helix-turn-helix transcriptional regulator [Clostridiaceae bacterium]
MHRIQKKSKPEYPVFHLIVGDLPLECVLLTRAFRESDRDDAVFSEEIIYDGSEEHTHAGFELIVNRRGSGFQFIDGCTYPYADAYVFLLAPFISHAHVCNRDLPEKRCSVWFRVDQDVPDNSAKKMTSALAYIQKNGFFSFSADNRIMLLVDLLVDVAVKDPIALEVGGLICALLSAVFQTICDTVCERSSSGTSSRAVGTNPNYRRFVIEQFFGRIENCNARIDDLCHEVHLSPSQLNRVLLELYGMSFKRKTIEVRIGFIKYFLKFSDLSFSEIAEKFNFTENSHFYRFFKRHCGETPSQYRAREQAKQ